MRLNVVARKTHKWLGLFVGLQVVIWSLSGLYMTVVHIDTIHGDHLIRKLPQNTIDAATLGDPLKVLRSAQVDAVTRVLFSVVDASKLVSAFDPKRTFPPRDVKGVAEVLR